MVRAAKFFEGQRGCGRLFSGRDAGSLKSCFLRLISGMAGQLQWNTVV